MTVLMMNVAKVYALSDKSLPTGDQGAAVLTGWADALDVIPTAWLDRTFKAAIRAHRGAFMVSFGEVLDAWDGLLNERMQQAQTDPARALPAGATVPCPRCHGAGWLSDRASGGPGQRAAVRCDVCQGAGTQAAASSRPTFYVNAILPILRAFGEEHRDPQNALTLVRWALACKAANLMPYDLRRLLESAGTDSLYGALGSLLDGTGVPVPPPVPLANVPPQAVAWIERTVGALPAEGAR